MLSFGYICSQEQGTIPFFLFLFVVKTVLRTICLCCIDGYMQTCFYYSSVGYICRVATMSVDGVGLLTLDNGM